MELLEVYSKACIGKDGVLMFPSHTDIAWAAITDRNYYDYDPRYQWLKVEIEIEEDD